MEPTLREPNGKLNFWRVAAGSFWVRFSATWFVVGAMFLSVGLMLIAGEWRYRADGITSQALVTNKEQRGEDHLIDYRFDAPGGRFEGSSQVPLELWNKLQVNDSVVVQYRAHDPRANRAQGHDNWVLIAIFTPMGAFFFGMGALLLVKSLRDLRKRMPDGTGDPKYAQENR